MSYTSLNCRSPNSLFYQTGVDTERPDDISLWYSLLGKEDLPPAPTYDVKTPERFISELSSIAKNRSQLHLIQELIDEFESLVLSCTYNGLNCNESKYVHKLLHLLYVNSNLIATSSACALLVAHRYFALDFIPDFGACYTFNSEKYKQEVSNASNDGGSLNPLKPKNTSMAGVSYGDISFSLHLKARFMSGKTALSIGY
jgi:hypothetical protein